MFDCYPVRVKQDFLNPRPLPKLLSWKSFPWFSGGIILAIVLVLGGAHISLGQAYQGKVLPGVSILGIDLGGEKVSEARYLINKRLSLGQIDTIKISHDEKSWELNPVEFGFRADVDLLIEEAMNIGRSGNLIADFDSRMRSLAGEERQVIIATSKAYSFDRDKLKKFLDEEVGKSINQPVQDAKLVVVGKRAKEFQPDQSGQTLNIEKSVEEITGSLLSPDGNIKLVVDTEEPKVSLASTNKMGIATRIARGVSDFTGSPKNRRHNIQVGAGKFDGLIVEPGKVMSFMRELGPVDASAGFLPELVIKEDKTTPEFGGGLCQVSTTTFRAVLDGGLEITERRNHSYRVAYYEPAGTDATVYDPYPDFKFTNDTPGHILIDTYIEGNKLYFDFYGTDTGRTVEMDGPHISNVTALPEPIYIDTSTLPPGEIKQIETAHRGASAVLYRKVTGPDGKVLHSDEIKSLYIPWPAKYLRGVEEADPVDTNLSNIADPAAVSEDSKSEDES